MLAQPLEHSLIITKVKRFVFAFVQKLAKTFSEISIQL